MTKVRITAGPYDFEAEAEEQAPTTVARFVALLPYRQQIIHVRWSGEGCWIPLGDYDFGLAYENHTSYPAPGEIILYPGGISETEILLAYGAVSFASKVGQLAGNHFLTVTKGRENLTALGKLCLWKGAQRRAHADRQVNQINVALPTRQDRGRRILLHACTCQSLERPADTRDQSFAACIQGGPGTAPFRDHRDMRAAGPSSCSMALAQW